MQKKFSKGFTMLEMLLIVAAIAILSALSIPAFIRMQTRTDLDVTQSNFVAALRQAQSLAQGVTQDSTWGVKAQSGSIVVFKGASYATRDTTADLTITTSEYISVSGTSEYVFNKLTGFPQTAGSITLASNADSATLTINSKGAVDY